jgi:hypothetical protein
MVEIGPSVNSSHTSRQASRPSTIRPRRRHPDLSEALQLPVDGLFSDLSAGVGSVCLPDEFMRVPGAAQLSIVRDWSKGLEGARLHAFVNFYRETVGKSALPLPQKLARFREICAQHGEECPPDMARLLQQF